MGGVAREEHAPLAVVARLASLAEEPGAPARLLHAEVVARDAPERRHASRRIGHRLVQRHLLAAAGPTRSPGTSRRRRVRRAPGPPSPVAPNIVSSGGRVETDVGQHDVGRVLRADEVHPDQAADRAVRAVRAHDVAPPSPPPCPPRPSSSRTVSPSWVRPTTSTPRRIGDAELTGAPLQQLLGAALRARSATWGSGCGGSRDPAFAPGAGDTPFTRTPRGMSSIGQAARVQQFEGAGVDGERAGDVGLLGAPLEHRTAALRPVRARLPTPGRSARRPRSRRRCRSSRLLRCSATFVALRM